MGWWREGQSGRHAGHRCWCCLSVSSEYFQLHHSFFKRNTCTASFWLDFPRIHFERHTNVPFNLSLVPNVSVNLSSIVTLLVNLPLNRYYPNDTHSIAPFDRIALHRTPTKSLWFRHHFSSFQASTHTVTTSLVYAICYDNCSIVAPLFTTTVISKQLSFHNPQPESNPLTTLLLENK